MVFNHKMKQSIESMQSTLRKLENSKNQMMQKGASTTLVSKRLQAIEIGLALLEYRWDSKPFQSSREEIMAAREVLDGLMPSLENMYEKSKPGSPQRTLLERRIRAIELSIEVMKVILNDSTIDKFIDNTEE
ncbi:hypothetical protein [Sporosarcina cyprini]|uniref:hypothetical protein n=1 Tax=Sporosarcina cyprini TaxID=2910523 RepID=UPI001EE0B73F|nr:hypothetical protein [Sporosarcina cyprini]MCG3087690.1 hypothetical protein [Sporosarcina cyprini]